MDEKGFKQPQTEIRLCLAHALIKERKLNDAVKQLEKIIQEDPDCEYALSELARITEYQDQEKALDYYL